jgi:hypothetical protein
MPEVLFVRKRWVLKLLCGLYGRKRMGPDRLPSRILQACADVLARPIALLTRLIFALWEMALEAALGSPAIEREGLAQRSVAVWGSSPSVVSKVVERAIGNAVCGFL